MNSHICMNTQKQKNPKIAIATANVSIVWHYDSQSAHFVGMHADKIKQTVIEYKQVEI